jgi:hypothetical protein
MIEEIITKKCSSCKFELSLDNFITDKKAKYGKRCYCKSCDKIKRETNKESHKLACATWRVKNKTKHREDVRFNSYIKLGINITREEYKKLYDYNMGYCDICGEPDSEHKILNLDHCHKTGKVRGFLCDKCNKGLGLFRDNPIMLAKAAEYLKNNG